MFHCLGGVSSDFGGVRLLVSLIVHNRGPFSWVMVRGHHIHHLVWGILILSAGGLWMAAGPGTLAFAASIFLSRLMAVSYGVGAALTLDEFALWLNLEPDAYWSSQGRLSIDAVILFGSMLGVGAWGAPFFRGLHQMWTKRTLFRREAGTARGRLFGVCGCFVRVKFGDHRRVSFRDDAALELH